MANNKSRIILQKEIDEMLADHLLWATAVDPDETADRKPMDLSGEYLTGIEFRKVDLMGALFNNTCFSDCVFENVYLLGASFKNAIFIRCRFIFDENTSPIFAVDFSNALFIETPYLHLKLACCMMNGVHFIRTNDYGKIEVYKDRFDRDYPHKSPPDQYQSPVDQYKSVIKPWVPPEL